MTGTGPRRVRPGRPGDASRAWPSQSTTNPHSCVSPVAVGVEPGPDTTSPYGRGSGVFVHLSARGQR